MIDSLRTYRDIIAYALLGITGATLLASFIQLIDDRTLDATLSAGSVLLVALAVAIVAPRKDDLSPNARIVTIASLAVLGVALLLGVWGLLKMLTTDLLRGKADLAIGQLAALALTGLVLFAVITVLQVLPAPVRAPQQQPQAWGQQGQWGAPQGQPQQGGWPQQAPQQQTQQPWGDQGGWQQQAPAQQQGWSYGAAGAAGAAGYAAGEAAQGWGATQEPAQEPQQADAPAPEVEPAEQSTAVWTPPAEEPASPWASPQQPQPEQSSWGAPQQPEQEQNAWGTQQASGWGNTGGWGQQPEQQAAPAWGQESAERSAWQQPTEYGSGWGQQSDQYAAPQQEQSRWQAEGSSWGESAQSTSWPSPAEADPAEQPVSRLGDATFDAPATETTYEAGSVPTSESADAANDAAPEGDKGDQGDDDQRPSSWWTPGSST